MMLVNWASAAYEFSVISKGQHVGSGECKKRKREPAAYDNKFLVSILKLA